MSTKIKLQILGTSVRIFCWKIHETRSNRKYTFLISLICQIKKKSYQPIRIAGNKVADIGSLRVKLNFWTNFKFLDEYFKGYKSFQNSYLDSWVIFSHLFPRAEGNWSLGPWKVKNDPKIKSKSKVRISRNIENESRSTTWVDPKTVF